MDTQTAIDTLQAIANTLTDEVKGAQAKLDAVNLAISQLAGVLTTQLAELDEANATIATLQTATQVKVTP